MGILSRRRWLQTASCGFGGLALSAMTTLESLAAGATRGPFSSSRAHFPARAKSVIFLYMHGGTSHIDTFDQKPELDRRHGQPLPDSINTGRNRFKGNLSGILKSPWLFTRYGGCGLSVSSLFPHVGSCADELCMINSMYSNNNAHTP
ncbi:uncharacterized protein METZ01_LOCUS182593, partial [marine metagenome]